ncbi:MAG: Fe-S cluster assembly ATPase SufC [Candidatus Peribacteraceae bacterium]|jgi:Fe-S cluster assembly ATP-binding protein
MDPEPLLQIDGLRVCVGEKEVVQGVYLTINHGEVHALMGPNGSGKSSLVHALAGHPDYQITAGTVRFAGQDIQSMDAHERALAGLFLAFQYPREIPGITLRDFLYAAYKQQMAARQPKEKRLTLLQFQEHLHTHMDTLHMDFALAERPVNQGFSGGEKKKAEILQLRVLQPKLALLDETDSGLDIDALSVVARGVEALRSPQCSFLVVTHYARILEYIIPDHTHVMVGGKIVASGDAALAASLEEKGYEMFTAV